MMSRIIGAAHYFLIQFEIRWDDMTWGGLLRSEQEFPASDVTILGAHLPTDGIQATARRRIWERITSLERLLDHEVALL